MKLGAMLPLPSLNEWLQCTCNWSRGRALGWHRILLRSTPERVLGNYVAKWTTVLQIEHCESKLYSSKKYVA
jgi:hypothetical protein